jgi:Asp-tRNA(Asn)/Glu-tRNA(Gln) amidotransferase A subunit family amidase
MTELWMKSALELGAMIASGEVSSEELVRCFLDRIDWLNGSIGAYVTVCPEEALQQARAADQAVAFGVSLLTPLWGVPVSFKDLIETRGIRTTFGSTFFREHIPAVDAVLVERVRLSGCPILGKTNTSEFGCKFNTDNRLFGVTRNPWELALSPGGSAGGAAAQVALGLGPLAFGNDGGGSIRVPASCCGVFGIKPQFGRVPSWPRHEGWSGLNHEGPIARTVRDAAALLDAVAGPDERDRGSLPGPTPRFLEACEGDIRGWRVAWSPDLGYGLVDPQVKAVCEDAVRAFEDLGCVVEETAPSWESPHGIFVSILAPRMRAWLEDWLPSGFQDQIDPALAALLRISKKLTSVDVARAQFGPERLWDLLGPFFNVYDLWLTPTIATSPYALEVFGPTQVAGEPIGDALMPFFTYPFNLTGQPAASVPAGFTTDGLPVGLQIVGRRFRDDLVLRAAARFEEARPWGQRWPRIACG